MCEPRPALSSAQAPLGITLHLRVGEDAKPPATLAAAAALLKAAGSPPALKRAPSLGSMVAQGVKPSAVDADTLGIWLAAAPVADPLNGPPYGTIGNGTLLTVHGSLAAMDDTAKDAAAALLRLLFMQIFLFHGDR